MQESVDQIKQLVVNVRSGIQHIAVIAPQLMESQRRFAMLRFIVGLGSVAQVGFPQFWAGRGGVGWLQMLFSVGPAATL